VDLLSIARKLWRYRLVTIPVVLLTLFGAFYVFAVKPPVYKAESSYVLINPPGPPTDEQIAQDPALGRVRADNPYTRFGDTRVVLEILAGTMNTRPARQALLAAGADPRFAVVPTSAFGFSSPMVQVSAEADSAATAIKSAKLVSDALKRQLANLQRGTDPTYRLTAQPVQTADGATLQASGKLRSLVGVMALGSVLLFVLVSLADALTSLRSERKGSAAPSRLAGNDQAWFDEETPGGDQLVNLFPKRDAGARAPTDPDAGESRHRRSQWRRF
jgi:hypothetical protein